jgi:acyl carrier protein
MDDIRTRLTECFQIVFPDLSDAQIPSASQQTVEGWDSVATITLINVIEEQFGVEMDLDHVAELDTFEKVCAYLQQRCQPA